MADLTLPKGLVLIQYVDGILLAAPDHVSCLEATKSLLMQLYHIGFKVSRAKLQCCRQTVSFLGRIISVKGTGVSPSHKSSILHHVKPTTVKDILSFLGLTGYSRQFIASYGELTSPLRAMVNEQGMRNLSAKLHWTTVAEESFISLKQTLTHAADLAVPDYKEPFFLDVSEKSHTVNGVLFQKTGGCRQVLMYVLLSVQQKTDTRHAHNTQQG